MSLNTKLVDSDFSEIDQLEKLNNEAFPEAERIPTPTLIAMADNKQIDLIALYDADKFIGFIVMSLYEQYAYMFFFAIDSSQRSKGYGSKALSLLRNVYAKYTITLDLEKVDCSAPNNNQRIARKNFYLRNGYSETGYSLDYLDITFEVLFSGQNFDEKKYTSLLNNIMRNISSYKIGKFEPSLYRSA